MTPRAHCDAIAAQLPVGDDQGPRHRWKFIRTEGQADLSEELLSDLISDVYDAALDPALWEKALEKSYVFVGGEAASVYSKHSLGRTAEIVHDVGVGNEFKQNYLDTYVKVDPTGSSYLFFDVGEVVATSDVMPYEEFLDTRFYREWAKPQGWVDTATGLLEKSSTSFAAFSVFRHERHGLVDDEARRRMKLLIPHFRRAVLIGKTIELNRADARMLSDTLDHLAAAVFLMDAGGRLVRANLNGHVLLSEGAVLRAAGGRLVAVDPVADQALSTAFSSLEAGDAGLGTQGVAVPLGGADGQRHVAHLLPLNSGARRKAGVEYSAAVAVFVCKARAENPTAPEVIARIYRLTPSELRVLLAIFETGGVSDVSAMLGISEATTRTHIHRLLGKTGSKRQSDLVKLVAGFAGSVVRARDS
jgi:DNA-binding CsgD family transcriptional regulator